MLVPVTVSATNAERCQRVRGGLLVGHVPPSRLRTLIVFFGVVVALIYLFR